MKLIVGLGNPGMKYKLTRHNVGFLLIDAIKEIFDTPDFTNETILEFTKAQIGGQTVMLLKPQTYMNKSGEVVKAFTEYYKIDPKDMLVAHDEIDLPPFAVRFQSARGHGGHNGIRNIHEMLGSDQYDRLKLGVGRPSNPRQEVADYVLQNFSNQEMEDMGDFLSYSADAVEMWIKDGIASASNHFNRKGP